VPFATPSTSIVHVHSGPIRGTALIGAIVTLSAVLSAGSGEAAGKLVSISLSPTKRAIGIGQTVSCHAVGHFSSDTTQDMTTTVTWTSSNPAVVAIDATGKAQGLAFGSATMQAVDPVTGIASTSGGVIAVVAAPKTLKITPAGVIVALGASTTLKASATFNGITGSFNVSRTVQWSSSNLPVATVDTQGKVTCLTSGMATISVKDVASGVTSTASGGDANVNCGASIIGIKVSPARNILQPGTSRQMHAFLVPATGDPVDATRDVLWTSRSPSTVSIVADGANRGVATALRPGRATIIATDPTRRLSSNSSHGTNGLLLVPGPPQSVTIFPRPATGGSITGVAGGTQQFRARVTYQGGVTQGVNSQVTWSSSNTNVVTVSNGEDGAAGLAHLLRQGTVTISIVFPATASSPALKDSVQLTVH
jgi:Big-like domain-containing protein